MILAQKDVENKIREVVQMITLNDYLYSGDTVLKILQRYMADLREDAKKMNGREEMRYRKEHLSRFQNDLID